MRIEASNQIKTPKELVRDSRKWTIPNILTCFRIVLIPVFVWLYCFRLEYELAALTLVISGITDILDGWIARTFHMISDLGKVLDPVADKLTQAAILVVLSVRYPLMMAIFVFMLVKELSAFWSGLQVVKKTGVVLQAEWHGKMATVLLYTMLLLHAFWFDIPEMISCFLMGICTLMLILSGVLYHKRNRAFLQKQNAR